VSTQKKGNIDPNKSQVKGSRAKNPRRLNLSTSLLFDRKMRQEMGRFSGQNSKVQTPAQIFVGGVRIVLKEGIDTTNLFK
jgi:hypothetical protein